MIDYQLSDVVLRGKRAPLRQAKDKGKAYRLDALVQLARGRTAEPLAEGLLVTGDALQRYFWCYRQGGIARSQDAAHVSALCAHLQEHVYLLAKVIPHRVYLRFAVPYRENGVTGLPHRTHHLPRSQSPLPARPPRKLKAFLPHLEPAKVNYPLHSRVYFLDSTYWKHNPLPICGRIKPGRYGEPPPTQGAGTSKSAQQSISRPSRLPYSSRTPSMLAPPSAYLPRLRQTNRWRRAT